MSVFGIYPPEQKELFLVKGIDELEHITFATCTTREYAEKAQRIIKATEIETQIVVDHLGLNTIELDGERIDLTQAPPALTK